MCVSFFFLFPLGDKESDRLTLAPCILALYLVSRVCSMSASAPLNVPFLYLVLSNLRSVLLARGSLPPVESDLAIPPFSTPTKRESNSSRLLAARRKATTLGHFGGWWVFFFFTRSSAPKSFGFPPHFSTSPSASFFSLFYSTFNHTLYTLQSSTISQLTH